MFILPIGEKLTSMVLVLLDSLDPLAEIVTVVGHWLVCEDEWMFSSIEGVELGDVDPSWQRRNNWRSLRAYAGPPQSPPGDFDEDDMEGEDSEEEDKGMEVDKEYSDKYDEKSMEDDDQDGKDEDYFNLQHAWEILATLFLQVFYRQLL